MEINVGDYVRGFRGINKVIKIEPYNESYFYYTDGKNNNEGKPFYFERHITSHSKDIIDLIENEDEAIIEYINEFNKMIIRRAFIDIKNDFIVFKTTYETLKYYIPTKEWFHFNSCGDFYKFKPTTNPFIKSILTHEQFEANAYTIEKEEVSK